MPRVSFMTIAYNEESYLPRLLDDLKAQDYPHDEIEVVMVDSGSTDATKSIMHDFAEKSDFAACKVLDNPKRRQASGWNTAIKAASGDILVRIDAHARLESDFITCVVREIDSGEDIVGGQRVTVFEGEKPFSKLLAHAESSAFGSAVASYRRKVKRSYVKTLAHAAYKRGVFDKVGLFNENLLRTEDNELHYRMRKAGYRFCQCPDICSCLYARSTLGGMIKQKWGNGFWVGATLPLCPGCLSIYNFVPAVFVLALLSAVYESVRSASAFSVVFLLIIYALAALAASVKEMIKEKSLAIKALLILLPPIFLIMHVAYGLGTLVGLIFSPALILKSKQEE